MPASRVFVTCMGVDTSELVPLGKRRSYDRGTLRIATVARLNPAKGHVHALAAIQRGLQTGLNLHYTIAGEGPHKEAVKSAIRERGLGPHVSMPGTLSEADVLRLLGDADAFLLPSIGFGEAWPVSVMEAMGTGLPVIASVIGATPEMITPDVDGFLVPQRDEDRIFEKITLLANDVDLRRRIGDAARHTAQTRFDVRTTAGALLDAVASSLEPAPLGRRAL